MNYQDGYSQKALDALAKGKYKSFRSSGLANYRYTEGKKKRDNIAVAKQNKKQNPTPRNTNAMANDPRFSLPSVSLPVPTLPMVNAMQNDPRYQAYDGDQVLNQLIGSVQSPVKESPSLPDMLPKAPKERGGKRSKARPATRYKNEPATQKKEIPQRDTTYDKDFAEYWDARFANHDIRDYDPVTDQDIPHWQNVKKNIMQKHGWTEEEFEKNFKPYNAEQWTKMDEEEIQGNIGVADKSPFLGALLNTMYLPQSMVEGTAGIISKLTGYENQDFAGSDPLVATRSREGMKTAATKDMGTVGSALYNIGAGQLDRAVASQIPILGTAALGGETAARTLLNAENRGVDDKKAGLQALGSGIASGFFNRIGFNKMAEGGSSPIGNILKGAAAEGAEEGAEELFNIGLDTGLNLDKSELATLHDYYVGQGMSSKQAWLQVAKDKGIDLATSIGTGALFGGLFSTANEIPELKTRLSNVITEKAKDAKYDANQRANQARVPDVVEQAKAQAERAQAEIERLNEQLPEMPEDVINEDITPDIETAVANTRDYTPQEVSEINDFIAQRDAVRAKVEEAAGRLMTTNPADLQNLFTQLENIDNDFYGKYPELFVNGKFAGAPENVSIANDTGVDTTPRVTEAAGESAPVETPESVVAELNQTPVETNDTGIDNRAPAVTENNVPPATGKEKVSEYRGSTMRNTGVNQDMEDAEFDKRFDKKNFTFESKEEQESVDQAKGLIKDNGEEGTSNIILNKENGSLKQYEIDAGQMLADKAERAALDLESQGKDATEEWNKAITLHKKLQSNGSVQAQGLQALKKWKNNTVWGLLDYVIADTRKAIDKKKTPGYSNMVNDLADEVEDAINKGKSPNDIINGIRKVFEENRKKSPYKTTKLEQQVLSFVNDPKSKQKFASSLAEEAGRLIKKNMGVSTITTAQQKQMLDLFREACKYDEGSRPYNELVGRAMQLYDSTLPASLPSMVKSLLYDNMLFSPKTMMSRNFMGNVGEYGLEKASKPFQVGADVLTGLVTKDRTRTFSKNGIKEGAKGFVKGIKDWGLDIAHGVNTPRSGKQTVEDIFNANRKTFKTQSENKIIKGITKFLGGYDTLVRKGMELGDRIIYEPKFAATKAELYDVIDKFGDSGLRRGLPKGKDYSTEDLVNMIATKEALESVLQNDTLMKEGASALKKALSKTSQEVLGFDVASMTISPFVEVPANKASRFLQFTPLGILGNAGKSIREKIQYGSVNQRRATGEAGRTAFGTLATAGMTALGSNLVSGAKSKDPEERKVQENNGYQEYAIQLPNGKQVDITDMTSLPGYAKRLREGYDEGGIPGLLRSMPSAIGKATLDSLYSGVNRLAGTSYSTNNQMGDTIPEKALNAILSSGNMLVPQTVRQTAQLIDPYKRDLGDYGTAEYNRNLVINGLPVLRQMLLDPKIDTSGNYVPELGGEKGVKRFLDAYLAPYKVSDPEAMKSERVLAADAIKEATNGEVKAYPDIIQKNDLNVKGYDMDNYSHKDLAALREEVYNRSDDLSTWVINQDWFKDIDPAYQGNILTSIDSASKALGLEDMVRKGKTEEEIAKSGEDLYSAGSSVKALTEILRKDDKNHTLLKEFLQKDINRQEINDEYGIKMSRKEYEAHEDDPTYAQDKVAATERDLKTETYRKVYDYASSMPNVSSDDLDKALPVLQGMGIKKQSGYYTYINAKSVVPNLTAEEFANTFNAIDEDGNNGIKKDEFAAWLTLKNPTLEQAQKYTDMYYTNTNEAGEKRKVKKADNGWAFYY